MAIVAMEIPALIYGQKPVEDCVKKNAHEIHLLTFAPNKDTCRVDLRYGYYTQGHYAELKIFKEQDSAAVLALSIGDRELSMDNAYLTFVNIDRDEDLEVFVHQPSFIRAATISKGTYKVDYQNGEFYLLPCNSIKTFFMVSYARRWVQLMLFLFTLVVFVVGNFGAMIAHEKDRWQRIQGLFRALE